MNARSALVGLAALLASVAHQAQAASSCALLDRCAIADNFDADFVRIEGSPDFDEVPLNGEDGVRRIRGRVPYPYRIGRYEVTNCQYAAFLKAVAAQDGADADTLPDDPHNLYFIRVGNSGFEPMSESPHAGIRWCDAARRAAGGTCSELPPCPEPSAAGCYAVKRSFERRPVVFVNFFDAARFANWLDDGCRIGGQTEDGPYPFVDARGVPLEPRRQAQVERVCRGARYFLPSEDEWYKAAYLDPASGRFYDFPTGSDTVTCRRPEVDALHGPPGRGSANCGYAVSAAPAGSDPYAADHPVVRPGPTPVGAYGPASASPSGTLDQAGNVMEWSDTPVAKTLGVSPPVDIHTRVALGASWDRLALFLMHRNWREGVLSMPRGAFGGDFDFIGFRVASRAGDVDACPPASQR